MSALRLWAYAGVVGLVLACGISCGIKGPPRPPLGAKGEAPPPSAKAKAPGEEQSVAKEAKETKEAEEKVQFEEAL